MTGTHADIAVVPAFDTLAPASHDRAVRILLPVTLVAYAGVAVANGWWLSAVLAPLLAWLLWRRHPRARFAAYIFFSVMTARAFFVGSWPLALFALAAIGALQLPAARRVWPRLTPGRPLR